MGDGVKLKEGRNETDQSLRSRRRTTRSGNNEIEKDGNCRSDEGEGERMIDDRRKESESGAREEGGARREVEVWNGSVVAVPRLGSHACLRFRVVACLCSRVCQFAFSPSFSLSLSFSLARDLPLRSGSPAGPSRVHETAA